MYTWLVRGLALAAAMVAVRLVQGTLINQVWQTRAGTVSIVLVALFAVAPLVWGSVDGRADATAHPDPDRRADLAMTWLVAGLVAGALSGLVAWLITLIYPVLYTGGLFNELTTFASFTALLVFLAGMVGVTAGRWLVDRNPAATDRKAPADTERADTDVFAAVSESDLVNAGAALQDTALADASTTTVATGIEPVPQATGRFWRRSKKRDQA